MPEGRANGIVEKSCLGFFTGSIILVTFGAMIGQNKAGKLEIFCFETIIYWRSVAEDLNVHGK